MYQAPSPLRGRRLSNGGKSVIIGMIIWGTIIFCSIMTGVVYE